MSVLYYYICHAKESSRQTVHKDPSESAEKRTLPIFLPPDNMVDNHVHHINITQQAHLMEFS